MVVIVGPAGLRPTLAALKAGKDVVLANKESLVVGGSLITEAANLMVRIIPADMNTMRFTNACRERNKTWIQSC